MSDLLWETDLNSEQRQYLDVFRRAGTNLLMLINDILDLFQFSTAACPV